MISILSYTLRVIALSFLFAGSTAVIFCAMTLINAATARGIPVSEAAAQNAPVFTMYSTVIVICAGMLLLSEALHYAKHKVLSGPVKARYLTSLICVAAALILKLGIIPQMELLTHAPAGDERAHAEFKKLHSVSRINFTVIIVTALISLLLPGFDLSAKVVDKKPEDTPALS